MDLKQELSEYGKIVSQLDLLDKQKEEKKKLFKQYLEEEEFISDTDVEVKYDSQDMSGKMWRITNSKTTRTKPDWKYIESVLSSDQLKSAKIVTDGERFVVSQVNLKGDENDVKSAVPIVNT